MARPMTPRRVLTVDETIVRLQALSAQGYGGRDVRVGQYGSDTCPYAREVDLRGRDAVLISD